MSDAPDQKYVPPAESSVAPAPDGAKSSAGGEALATGSPPAAPLTGRGPMLYMRRLWRNVALLLLLLLLAVSTWFAALQPPHPDMFRPVGLWDIGRADWWAHPLERNAFKRLVVRGGLAAVFVLPDGEHVWAVGERGLILHSADRGQTWEQQRPAPARPTETARQAALLERWLDWVPSAQAQQGPPPAPVPVDGSKGSGKAESPAVQAPQVADKKGVAASARTTVRQDPKPGPTIRLPPAPLPPPVPPDQAALTAVYFTNPLLGWAVGEGGTVLATQNGGSTWVVQTSGTRIRLHGVQFAADALRGWAVGDAGTVLTTQNGGANWAVRGTGSRSTLRALHFAADGLKGWAVGEGGTVLATRDGGSTWAAQTSGTGSRLLGVHFAADALTGWAVGEVGTLLGTRDGGSNWSVQKKDVATISDLHFAADARKGWAVGQDGALLSTRDGGASWVAQASGTRSTLSGVRFAADGLTGVAVGQAGTLLATQDGGNTWVARTAGGRSTLQAVHFAADALRGWAIGDEGTVLATRDGGSTWVVQASGTRFHLRRVHFAADAQKGWAVGEAGTVLATDDGGSRWVAQRSGVLSALWGLDFAADALRGWAVGRDGTVLVTRDGGSNWLVRDSNSQALLFAVHFAADAVKGWAVGIGGTVLATRDGGDSWAAQAGGTSSGLWDVSFAADALRGWAVGHEGTVITTRDGGSTWAAQTSGSRSGLVGVRFAPDALRGRAVGADGTTLATRDGGATWVAQANAARSAWLGMQFSADAQKGWVVGKDGTVLTTSDVGSTWIEPAQYRRYWAPWYFGVLVASLALLAGLVAFVEPVSEGERRPVAAEPAPGGAATTLQSDQPVLDKTGDQLGYRAAVQALSSFILNGATEPRVTIAVTGEWGTGKSSIMRMLQSDLESAGFRTAWFNAWHQQQEGQQLTALFNTIRQQAVPRWWGLQFVAALRVRSRLIWGRGWFYKTVAVASAVGCAFLLGDMLADGPAAAWQHVTDNFKHHVLQQQRTALTGASLAKLDPTRKPAAAQAASAPASGAAAEKPVPVADPCLDDQLRRNHKKAEPLRLPVYCEIKRNYLWDEGGDGSKCGVQKLDEPGVARRCIFDSAADLLATLNAQDKDGVLTLWPSEQAAIRAAAETLPPPPLFRWLESSLLGGLAGFIVVLFTKGVSVYGLQLTAPLRALLSAADKESGGGKEAAGTIERYRVEFGLLCRALDGRLVVFIDDLDRCSEATVNGVLEMSNYLVDIGRCFIVVGAAIDRVKNCIKPPAGVDDETYATEYLRKLIHIEMPVPLRRAELEKLLRDRPLADDGIGLVTRWQAPLRLARRTLLVLAAVVVLALCFATGRALHVSSDGAALSVLPRPLAVPAPVPASGAPAAAPAVVAASGAAKAARPEATAPVLEVGLSAGRPPTRPWAALLAGMLAVGAGFVWRWARRNRDQLRVALGGALRKQDSDDFLDALRFWNPVIVAHDPTPRHVKRFYNRARLFAAYEIEEAKTTDSTPADDAGLVLMAALHHVEPDYLVNLAALTRLTDRGGQNHLVQMLLDSPTDGARLFESPDGSKKAQEPLATELLNALRAHLSAFKRLPSAEQIERFVDRVRGVKVR